MNKYIVTPPSRMSLQQTYHYTVGICPLSYFKNSNRTIITSKQSLHYLQLCLPHLRMRIRHHYYTPYADSPLKTTGALRAKSVSLKQGLAKHL